MALSSGPKVVDNAIMLNTSLGTLLLTVQSRHTFAQGLWHRDFPLESFQLPNFESYFRYYRDQCVTALSDNPENPKSHREVIDIAQQLIGLDASSPSLSPVEKDGEERRTSPGTQAWSSPTYVGQWALREFISSVFPQSPVLLDEVKLERLFNARNLERVAGIQVIWTSNIADHLQLEDDDTSVRLFSHASFLELHRYCDIFPPGFVEETLRTLSLLLPSGDKKTLRWFRREQKRCVVDELIDGTAIKCHPLTTKNRQIGNFVFWHDRLVMLKQAFDEADPKTVRQWWSDRRKPVQWLNFWFAVALVVGLTIFFGLVQRIEGAIQVYKAYHPSS